jgi:hypothetical protein
MNWWHAGASSALKQAKQLTDLLLSIKQAGAPVRGCHEGGLVPGTYTRPRRSLGVVYLLMLRVPTAAWSAGGCLEPGGFETRSESRQSCAWYQHSPGCRRTSSWSA